VRRSRFPHWVHDPTSLISRGTHMQNDRRRFLVAGAAGMTTLLLAPQVSLACFCRRRRHAPATACAGPRPSHGAEYRSAIAHGREGSLLLRTYPACPVWSPQNPWIPDASNISASTPHAFTIFGAGLSAWQTAGGSFRPNVSDYYNPSTVIWGSYIVDPVVPGMPGQFDSLTFSASETGSSPGGSYLLITVTLSPKPGSTWPPCPGNSWAPQPVTYT
jgi:hypothetical protein